jgi:hypothetical protein
MALAGAVVTVLVSIARYRERRDDDMRDATVVWQSLAEARAAETEQLKAKLALRETEIERLMDRNNFLWTALLRRTDLDALKPDPSRADSGHSP